MDPVEFRKRMSEGEGIFSTMTMTGGGIPTFFIADALTTMEDLTLLERDADEADQPKVKKLREAIKVEFDRMVRRCINRAAEPARSRH